MIDDMSMLREDLLEILKCRTDDSEIELRIQNMDATQLDDVVNLLNSGKFKITNLYYVDHVFDKCRHSRNTNYAVEKLLLSKHKYTITSDEFPSTIQFSLTHSNEKRVSIPEDYLPKMIRSVTRRSYVHKDYINFDISKVVQVEKQKYEDGSKAVVQDEIEIELSGKNNAYEAQPNKLDLYADSLIYKLLDIVYCVSHVSGNVKFSCQKA